MKKKLIDAPETAQRGVVAAHCAGTRMLRRLAHLCATFALVPLGALLTAQDLHDGPGKATVEKLCSNCHGLAEVVGLRQTKFDWQATVDDMASRGATGTDEEFDQVVKYLSRYFGKVNVNKADAKEIEEVLGVPSKQADAIVTYRTAKGDFKDLDALKKVPDVDPKKLDDLRDRIAFR